MLNRLTGKEWIYFVFFLSGASALIYETVWLRILIRVLGNTVYATSIILAAFMAGLALGSLFIGRLVENKKELLKVYAYLELGIALSAIALLVIFQHLMPVYQLFYHLSGDHRLMLTLVQSLIMFTLLLIPTFLMGGTLPLLSSHTKRYETSVTDRIGSLYGFNTLGAVAGVLGCGLILIGSIGETKTIMLGAAMNLFAAYVAYTLSNTEAAEISPSATRPEPSPAARSASGNPSRKMILTIYALSGFTAIAYEVVWTRMFQIYIGTSIYAFSLMLAFYLIGLAAGSLWGARALDQTDDPLSWFGLAQLGIAFYGALGLYLLVFFAKPVANSLDLGGLLAIPLIIVMPITFLLGAIFPALSKSFIKSENEVAVSVGQIYAANTAGCILGSLFCGFIFIAALGTRGTILLLTWLNIITGLSAFAISARFSDKLLFHALAGGLLLTTLTLGFLSPDPFLHVVRAAQKQAQQADQAGAIDFFFHRESAAATTTAFGFKNLPQAKELLVNGQGMTALCLETKLMAHLPLLLHPQPKNLLIVCFGMGTTLRSAWIHKDLKCDTVELVPEVYDSFKYFHSNAAQILADKRVRHFVDDGRNFLLMHPDQYDVITVDPAPPLWSAGTVNLYSQEFMALCQAHLKPGGIMCLWLPPVQFSEVIMVMKTFQSVFNNTYVWRGDRYPGFYLIGLNQTAPLDLKRFAAENKNQAVLADLNEWDRVQSVKSLRRLLLASPDQLAVFLKGTPIVTDDNPYTEFPLWRSLLDRSFQDGLDANNFIDYLNPAAP